MDITVEICEAAPAGRDFPHTVILHDGQLEQLARYATLIPSREINWARTFARRGLKYADYELRIEDYPRFYSFDRRAGANSLLPATASFYGREEAAYSEATEQGDLLTYLIEQPVLSFKICKTLELAMNCRANDVFPDGITTLISDYDAAVGISRHLREKWAPARFADELAQYWEPARSFLQITPSDIPF